MWKTLAIFFFTVVTGWYGATQQHSDLEHKRQVILDVNVCGKDDGVEPGLGREDFEIYEDGVKQDINAFSEEEEPFDVGILLDVSTTYQRKHISATIEAVKTFVKACNPDNRFFVVTFGNEAKLTADFTTGDLLVKQMGIPSLEKKYAVYDALIFGLRKVAQWRNRRKALLLITADQNSGSRQDYKGLISVVKNSDVQIYCLGVGNTSSGAGDLRDHRIGHLLLGEIAGLTGGWSYFKDEPHQLTYAVKVIAAHLRNQYKIEYSPTNQTDSEKWRKVKVKILPSSGRRIRECNARQGYYLKR
jgi:Ca-activated chloride channel family protein